MRSRVCALVEAAGIPGRNPLLPPLAAILTRDDIELVTWDPTGGFPLPRTGAPDADLYLVKGDDPAVLTAAGCLADGGARLLNSFEATAAATDKGRTLARLARAGIPVPATEVAADARGVGALLAAGPRFVKPVRGAHGHGARLLEAGAAAPAEGGPWLVQEPIAGDGRDHKVYGVGGRTAVRRMRFTPGVVDAAREPVADPDPRLSRWAVAAAEACGLVCFGADFIVGPGGPVLVDLNAFPGYRGVEAGPAWVAEAVRAALPPRQGGVGEGP